MNYIFTFLLFFAYVIGHAQQSVLTKKNQNQFVYRGLDNELIIMLEGVKCNEFIATTNKGSLKKLSDCNYNLTIPADLKDENVTISVTYLGKVVNSFSSDIRDIPKAEVALDNNLGNARGGEISILELKKSALIVSAQTDENLKYTIVEFEIYAAESSVPASEVNRFSIKQIALINKLNKGDRIFVQNIKVKNQAGIVEKSSNDLIFRIK